MIPLPPKGQKPPNKKHHRPKERKHPRRRGPNGDPIDFIESEELHTEAADDNDEEDAGDDATAPPPPEAKQKVTLKVDGKEEEVELDREEITKSLQMAAASQKRFTEAKAIQKQATDFIHLLQTDPLKIQKNPKLGIDFDKLSQDYLYEKFQVANMSPEQKEAHELKQELEALRHENKTQAEAAELQKQTTYYEERYNKEYGGVVGIAGLPHSDFIRRKTFTALSEAVTAAEKKGIKLPEEFGPKDVLAFVLEDYRADMKALMGEEGSKALDALLPKPTATPKSPTKPVPKKSGEPPQKKRSNTKRKWISTSDFLDEELYG